MGYKPVCAVNSCRRNSDQFLQKPVAIGGKGDVYVDKFNVMLEDDVQVVDLFKPIEKTKCDTTNDFNLI